MQSTRKGLNIVLTAMSHHIWRGVPLQYMYGSDSPWGTPEFPLVRPASNHTVLYHIPNNGDMIERPPKPQIGQDKWDKDHVRLPCSPQSLYPVFDNFGKKRLRERWDIIVEALSKPIRNSQDLVNAILTYNTGFRDSRFWKFSALHKLFDEYLEEEESRYFFDVTLPQIIQLALALPKLIQAPIPLLKQNRTSSVSLSQEQISCLLANAFFCTFPRRNSRNRDAEYATYPFINFTPLFNYKPFDNVLEKIKCICHYFRRVCTKVPTGVVTFTRRSVPRSECPEWARSTRKMAVPVHVDPEAIIEDLDGLIQVDFANRYLGGGVLGGGCVQEEIRFVICPELMVSMMLTQALQPTEAVLIIGSERYSNYSGYGSSFHWSGDHVDATPMDSSFRRRCAVLALDAMPFPNKTAGEWEVQAIERELNKAWVGFSIHTEGEGLQYPGVATGNWGCGAFGGSSTLKSMLQIMASAQAGRPLAYCTFRDVAKRDYINRMYSRMCKHDVTVGQMYKMLVQYSQTANTDEMKIFLESSLEQHCKPPEVKPKQKPEPMSINPTPESAADQKPKAEVNIEKELLKNSPDMFEGDEIIASSSVKNEDDNFWSRNLKLLSQMDKIDQNSDNLNLTPTSDSQRVKDVPMAEDKHEMEVSPVVKKSLGKKITDYFSKQSDVKMSCE
ncbi:poly(ADP-ribose) glycohydrolase-like isoform X1 [Leptidea sinapis]|uniref:poly(ADP-ribose) glycohydrolase-like isoform X1 n=2 Tax=Leptidea sinapis TaxID=189913 RepID=UPI00212B8855|nr:poly(ADP-ribose) glycohydrolase-like isoform X1 [Leptidea sinapis]